jgi:hypothetical protein
MSTTITVTPVAATSVGLGSVIAPLAMAGIGLWAAARVLAAHDQECRRLLDETRDELRDERLAAIQLRTPDLDRLVQSVGEAKLASRFVSDRAIRIDSAGEPVWAMRTAGGVAVFGREAAVHRVLVANTISRVVEHLSRQGFTFDTGRKTPDSVNLVASGPRREVIDITVSKAGEAIVDPLNYSGPACERAVQDLAAAVDGLITQSCRKPEYFGGGVKIGAGKIHA